MTFHIVFRFIPSTLICRAPLRLSIRSATLCVRTSPNSPAVIIMIIDDMTARSIRFKFILAIRRQFG